MGAPDGGFYASLDADSEGEEGKFYVWKPDEIARVLGEERAAAFDAAYGVTAAGNFEGGATVLRETTEDLRAASREDSRSAAAKRETRGLRPAPIRKRMAAWNGMLISGLARAGSLLDDDVDAGRRGGGGGFRAGKADRRRWAAAACTYDLGRTHGSPPFSTISRECSRPASISSALARASDSSPPALRFADDIATRFFDEEALRSLSHSERRRAAGGSAALGPRRSDASLGGSGRDGPASRGLDRGPRAICEAFAEAACSAATRRDLEHAPAALPRPGPRRPRRGARPLGGGDRRGSGRRGDSSACRTGARRVLRPEDAVLVVNPEPSDKPEPTSNPNRSCKPGASLHRCRSRLDQGSAAGGRPPDRLRLSRYRVLAARTFTRRVDDTLLTWRDSPVCQGPRPNRLRRKRSMADPRDESKYGTGHDDGLTPLAPLDPNQLHQCRRPRARDGQHRLRRTPPRRGSRRARGDGARPRLLSGSSRYRAR